MILIGDYTIDAALSENHALDSEVTKYPRERGGTGSDNIRPLPISVTLECLVSDHPLGKIARIRASGADAGTARELDFLPSDEALTYLEKVRDDRETVSITTSRRTYESMGMERLTVTVDADTGQALAFTATFVQITEVDNNRTTVVVAPPPSNGTGTVNGKSKDLGYLDGTTLEGSPIVWHHRNSDGVFDDNEILGWNAGDVARGGSGLVHQSGLKIGIPLAQDELDEMQRDNLAYARLHDPENGAPIVANNPINRFLGDDQNATYSSRDGVHAVAPVYKQADGRWLDVQGHPIAQDPASGKWLEEAGKPTVPWVDRIPLERKLP